MDCAGTAQRCRRVWADGVRSNIRASRACESGVASDLPPPSKNFAAHEGSERLERVVCSQGDRNRIAVRWTVLLSDITVGSCRKRICPSTLVYALAMCI